MILIYSVTNITFIWFFLSKSSDLEKDLPWEVVEGENVQWKLESVGLSTNLEKEIILSD